MPATAEEKCAYGEIGYRLSASVVVGCLDSYILVIKLSAHHYVFACVGSGNTLQRYGSHVQSNLAVDSYAVFGVSYRCGFCSGAVGNVAEIHLEIGNLRRCAVKIVYGDGYVVLRRSASLKQYPVVRSRQRNGIGIPFGEILASRPNQTEIVYRRCTFLFKVPSFNVVAVSADLRAE